MAHINCKRTYSRKGRLAELENSVHLGTKYKYPACASTYSILKNLTKHFETKHPSIDTCNYCKGHKIFSKEHILDCLKVETNSENVLGKNKEKVHLILEDSIEPDLSDYPKEMHEVICRYWRLIRTFRKTDDILCHEYNYRWSHFKGNFRLMLTDIFLHEKSLFKADATLGCLLRNRKTGEFMYWPACYNSFTLLDDPVLVKNEKDVQKVSGIMKEIDLEEKFTWPGGKWALAAIINVEFSVVAMKNFLFI